MKNIDFTNFLSIYGNVCGLSAPKMKSENIWIPDNCGIWREIDKATTDALLRHAMPYTTSAGPDDERTVSMQPSTLSNVWVAVEEVADVLMVAGLKTADADTDKSLATLAHMLPGLTGVRKLSFQELLTVYHDVAHGKKSTSPAVSAPVGGAVSARGNGNSRLRTELPNKAEANNLRIDSARRNVTLPASLGRFKAWKPTEQEFRDLDIKDEGKLTYLSLKSSLEIRDEHVSDDDIRQWIRTNDKGAKGFVDIQDFMRATSFIGSAASINMSSTERIQSGQTERTQQKFQERDKIDVLKR